MWPFKSHKYETLRDAVLAGDIRAVRTMLDEGADPNKVEPGDDATPINYAINQGPEMVQVLVDRGADVNVPRAWLNASGVRRSPWIHGRGKDSSESRCTCFRG